MNNNLILCDCESSEIQDLRVGIEQVSQIKFDVLECITNLYHGNIIRNIRRFAIYFFFPLKIFMKRENVDYIIGWQQFYAINYAFFCKLFRNKKAQKVVVLNFTYKKKSGVTGFVYHRYIKYAITGGYIDYFHVLSLNYAKECSRVLGIPFEKFIVTGFGVPDNFTTMQSLEKPCKYDYCLSIGRSNRDFDFLVRVWQQEILKDYKLVIISDTWHYQNSLPENIYHFSNIIGEDSLPWISKCEVMIIPIDNEKMASGDTVLLNGMMAQHPVIITKPSTLAEMYIEDRVDGICIDKDEKTAAIAIAELLNNKPLRKRLGENARKSYLQKFSRYNMGEIIAKILFRK